MLVHQRQGSNECLPTAVAVLAGVPKDDVIEWARQKFNVASCAQWDGFAYGTGNSSTFWMFATAVIEHFIAPGVGRAYHGAVIAAFPSRYALEVVPGGNGPTRRTRRLFKGRGLITIRRGRFQHVVAFENGVVFDSGQLGPLPYKEWCALKHGGVGGWRVTAVQYLESQPAPDAPSAGQLPVPERKEN